MLFIPLHTFLRHEEANLDRLFTLNSTFIGSDFASFSPLLCGVFVGYLTNSTSSPERSTVYCHEYVSVCLHVCVFVHTQTRKARFPNFTKRSVCMSTVSVRPCLAHVL